MSEFNIEAAIREAIESTGLADPREVAAEIVIPDSHRDRVLQHLLYRYVGDIMRNQRQTVLNRVSIARSLDVPARVGRSRWAKFTPELLDTSVSVAGERKLLGDCTVADLETIANEYGERAEQLAAYRLRFQDLAKRLRQSGSATLREATAAGPVRVEAAA